MNYETAKRIGSLIVGDAQRDAIHVAVAPVVAGCLLHPGERVGIVDGKATPATAFQIGVVDPFLSVRVANGERFYLFLDPGAANEFRHDWTHPDLDKPPPVAVSAIPAADEDDAYEGSDGCGRGCN